MSAGITLPDGRSLTLDDSVAGLLSSGVVVIRDILVGEGEPVKAEIEDVARLHRQRYAGRVPSEIEPLKEARDLYKSVGISPSRTRPSSEALLRRVLKGDSLYTVSNTVDVCNLASLSFLLPIGLYDLQKIQGDVVLRLGREGEEYPGIRKGPVHLHGRLGLFDADGPFGSPTSDSQRTSVTEDTRDILAVVMATAAYADGLMRENLEYLCGRMLKYCGGEKIMDHVLVA
jgi:DNA/RNA-binding domain of Phe-tRNA-synthetase-like protein